MQSLRRIIGYSLPFWLVFIFLQWYSNWDLSMRQLIKTSGLVGILLFALTFLIGPINKFMPQLSAWKIFRKYWGISATIIITSHMLLSFVEVYKSSLARMFSLDFSGARGGYRYGFWFGFIAFIYFVFMTLISNKKSIEKMGHWWKVFQSIGYVAFSAAIVHFVLLETAPGTGFIIHKPLGRLVFAISIAVVVMRLFVWLWTAFTQKLETPASTAEIKS